MMPRMISSMTGFSRQTHDDDWGSLVWELRSVNHRFLDINLRYPEVFRAQEMPIRELIKKHIARGKVDATLHFAPGPALDIDFSLNERLLGRLAKAERHVRTYFSDATLNVADILSWKQMLQVVEGDHPTLNKTMLELLHQTLQELISAREREGKGLSEFLHSKCQQLQVEVERVRAAMPVIIAGERARLEERLAEIIDAIDPQRLEQEMLIFVQRADVVEELQRLEGHLQEMNRILQAGGVVGRRLDFLIQELNREANTLSSKSLRLEITQSAVEMKVLIEQMREQAQNIE